MVGCPSPIFLCSFEIVFGAPWIFPSQRNGRKDEAFVTHSFYCASNNTHPKHTRDCIQAATMLTRITGLLSLLACLAMPMAIRGFVVAPALSLSRHTVSTSNTELFMSDDFLSETSAGTFVLPRRCGLLLESNLYKHNLVHSQNRFLYESLSRRHKRTHPSSG